MQYNYNYGDGGKLDQQTADFKAMGDDTNAKKKESVGKQYLYVFVLHCSIDSYTDIHT